AKPGLTQTVDPAQPPDRLVVWKNRSALPNIVNVGVRFGSASTMCSAFSSTGSASASAIFTGPPAYGSDAVALETSCSNLRTAGSVRGGPFGCEASPLT